MGAERKTIPDPRVGLLSKYRYPKTFEERLIVYFSHLIGVRPKDLLEFFNSEGGNKVSKKFNEPGALLQSIYGFSSPEIALDQFAESQNTVTEFIEYLIKTFGLNPDLFKIHNMVKGADRRLENIAMTSNSYPSRLFPDGVDPRMTFEQIRENLLVDMLMRLRSKARGVRADNIVARMKWELEKTFYVKGPAGASTEVTHQYELDIDNKVLTVEVGQPTKIPKKKTFRMRSIDIGNGEVALAEVDINKKSGISRLLKLVNDFFRKGKNIITLNKGVDPDGKELLMDTYRMHLVLNDKDQFKKVLENLKMQFDEITCSPINKDNGQAPTVLERYYGKKDGIVFEILFYDIEGYINSTKHVGTKVTKEVDAVVNGKKQTIGFRVYDGSAHELYEIRRALPLLLLLFPYEIYKTENQTPEEYIQDMVRSVEARSEGIARSLRE